jgi:catechol-2,3-dioxygenase
MLELIRIEVEAELARARYAFKIAANAYFSHVGTNTKAEDDADEKMSRQGEREDYLSEMEQILFECQCGYPLTA